MANETVVITGASRGIGEATARRLARKGRHLLLLARSELDLRRVQRTCRKTGATVDYRTVDLSHRDEVENLLDVIEHDYEAVDRLVLNAGTAQGRRFLESDPDGIDGEFELNFIAPTIFLRRLLGRMVERNTGRIALVGSLTAIIPFPGNATYSASKAALYALVRSLRLELADSEVHLGIVLPGLTRTAMTDQLTGVLPSLSPDTVARGIEQCLTNRRAIVIPGLLNNLAMRLFAAFPEVSDRLAEWLPDLIPHQPHPESPATETDPRDRMPPWPTAS